MKQFLKNIFSGLAIIAASTGAALAEGLEPDVCSLIAGLGPVFGALRTLCFIGAAFCILGWGWGFISSSKPGEGVMDDLKKKGIGLLVGFLLLFGVALIIGFLPGSFGCGAEVFK
ncbi:hypothetical protein FACS18945_3750 [Bacteroidia bacterium]|nr:hypothetical protein FACS18945_3750 [Bacteroidia bacterium]